MPRAERGEGVTYADLAILKLGTRQKVQGALGVITALTSMYLFSILGVEGPPNVSLWQSGAVGLITIGLAVLIEMFALVTGGTGWDGTSAISSGEGENATNTRVATEGSEGQRISLAKFGDDMVVAGMI